MTDPATQKVVNIDKTTSLKVSQVEKHAANLYAAEIAKELSLSVAPPADQPPKVLNFSYYVNEWLNNRDKLVRPNSAKSYRDYAKNHILPAFGNIPVDQITWRMLQEFCNQLLTNHAKSSVKKLFIVIRGALEDAVKDDVIQRNPAGLVSLPKVARYCTGVSLTKDETLRLLQAVENEQEPLRAAITLAVCYGLRLSEVCGLRWKDIDFKQNTMHIRNTLTQNGKLLLDEEHTKSQASRRALSLADRTVPYLKELYETQKMSGIQLDKVVTWPDGRYVRPDTIRHSFYRFLDRNGFEKIRFHDLRHTAATMLAESGLKPQHLQAFLGHSDATMVLNVYVHPPAHFAAAASQKMDEILGNTFLHPEER